MTTTSSERSDRSSVSLNHTQLLKLNEIKLRMSRRAGRMVSLQDAIVEMMRVWENVTPVSEDTPQ